MNNFFKTNKGKAILSKSNRNRAAEHRKDYPDLTNRLDELAKEGRLWGFGKEMHSVLKNGSRPFTRKMQDATTNFLARPEFDETTMTERKAAAKPLLEKVNLVYNLVSEVDADKDPYYIERYSALSFVKSVKKQVKIRHKLSPKQMEALNKVYKRYLKRKEKIDADKSDQRDN